MYYGLFLCLSGIWDKKNILFHVFKDVVLQPETGYQTAFNMNLNRIALSHYFFRIRFRYNNKQFSDNCIFKKSFQSPEKAFLSTSIHFLALEIMAVKALTIILGHKSSLCKKCLYSGSFWPECRKMWTRKTPNTGLFYVVHQMQKN